jgi:aspartate/methionine/tyrosine aminotransferase
VRVDQFDVEVWMNEHEMEATWNLGETCIDSLTLDELLELGGHAEATLRELLGRKLTYGDITGAPRLRQLIAALYESVRPEGILVTHGAIGANFLAEYTLVEPGDRVVCVQPTYQQLYSVPASFGAEVRLLRLRPQDGFLPDIDELRDLAGGRAKLICINNPNNPTGALIPRGQLEEIVEVARHCGAYLLADEVYRGLEHDRDVITPSIADLYERGVSTGSMSKVFSLAGLRLGWVAAAPDVIADCERHRDYTTISCSMLDEALAVAALEHRDRLLARNLRMVLDNAATLRDWLAGEPRVTWVPPAAGTTAFLRYDYDVPSDRFAQELFDLNGTFLVPGSCFATDGWLRVGYACSPAVLRGGLAGISVYMRQLEARGL